MELRHLRYFVAVAESGSITEAARRLHIQQPPLGQQIRDLESELGVALFDRYPRRIALNSVGQRFLVDARDILARAQHACSQIRRFELGELGEVSVALTSSTSLHELTPRIMQRFRESFPMADLRVEELPTTDALPAVAKGIVDVALLYGDPGRHPDICCEVLDYEEMVAAVPRGHLMALDRHRPLTLERLAVENMILYSGLNASETLNDVLVMFAQRGLRPHVSDEVGPIMAAINLVAGGRGITLVPASVRTVHPEAVEYLPIAPTELARVPLTLAHPRATDLALVANFVANSRVVSQRDGITGVEVFGT